MKSLNWQTNIKPILIHQDKHDSASNFENEPTPSKYNSMTLRSSISPTEVNTNTPVIILAQYSPRSPCLQFKLALTS